MDYDKGQCVIIEPKPEVEIVIFQWSRNYGDCYDCGLPAAFAINNSMEKHNKRCCVCAANAAVDGEKIYRIDGV